MPIPNMLLDSNGLLPGNYLDEFVNRCVTAEIEFLTQIASAEGLPGIDSKPFFAWQQATFPYITHRLSDGTPLDQGDSTQSRTYTVIARFVADHVSANVEGYNERLVYVFLPHIETLYSQNLHLVSSAYPAAMKETSPMPITFKRDTGTRFFDNRGTGLNLPGQIGFEYSITAEFSFDLRRRY